MSQTKFYTSFEEAKQSAVASPLRSGILHVTVIDARELLPIDHHAAKPSSDPYVILQLNDTRFQTDIIFNTVNPRFDETFSFRVENWEKDVIFVCVVHDNAHALTEEQADDALVEDNVGIGNAEIRLADLMGHINGPEEQFETWIKLTDVESGYLHLGFRFAKKRLN